MGVSGAGKSTVGRALAERLGWPYVDADALHSSEAVARMARGVGLTDADRGPWLRRLRALIEKHLAEGRPLVLACSALKARYRRTLARDGEPVRFVWLDVPVETLAERPALLASQLAAFEPPEDALRLDARAPPGQLVEAVVEALGLPA